MTIERASDNPFPSVLMVEGDPEALDDDAAVGQRRLAVGTDHLLYLVDDAGVKTQVGGSSGLSDPMTTRGDLIIRNASNVTARLGRGSASQVLTSDGTDIAWATPTGGGLAQSYVGYNTIGGTWTTVTAARQYTKKVTLAATSVFQSVDVYVRASTDNFVPIYVGLLTDNAGVPDLLIAAATSPAMLLTNAPTGVPHGGRWVSVPLGVRVTAASYWLAVAFPSAAYFDIANDGSGTDVYWGLTGAYMSGSHSALTKTTSAFKYSIRGSILS